MRAGSRNELPKGVAAEVAVSQAENAVSVFGNDLKGHCVLAHLAASHLNRQKRMRSYFCQPHQSSPRECGLASARAWLAKTDSIRARFWNV
jgi:hypothetical protein